MRNIKELSLGDYVTVKHVEGETVERVCQLEYRGDRPFVNGVSIDYVDFIPVTKELLGRNGFKNSKLEYSDTLHIYCSTEVIHRVVICDVNEWGETNDRYIIPCKYVHELQHILRNYGKEIEV